MVIKPKSLLKNKALNKWNLFWLISGPISIFMIINLLAVDASTGAGISEMIQFSVRWAVPFVYLVIATSSVQILFPGPFSRWLMRNRKYIGLCFAVAMAWQALFIFIMSYFFHEYYYSDVYYFRDEIEGSIGYIFLPAMVLTSFNFGSKLLTPKQWKLLHTSGIYFLWAYPFSVYWWNLYYYENPVLIDYVFYWVGFVAFALRIVAWGKQRYELRKRIDPNYKTPIESKMLGGLFIIFGLLVSASGLYWQDLITSLFTASTWAAELELWLPFWPFEPFLSLLVIGIGTLLITKNKTTESPVLAKGS